MLKSRSPRDAAARQAFVREQLSARGRRVILEQTEEALVLLEQAMRALDRVGQDTTLLDRVMDRLRDEHAKLLQAESGRVEPRTRPVFQPSGFDRSTAPRYRLFIDESGGTRLNVTTDSPYFAVGGLLFRDDALSTFNLRWQQWKAEWVGRENAQMHARNLREKHLPYYIKKGRSAVAAAAALHEIIEDAACQLFVAAIDKPGYQRAFMRVQVDAFLPINHYEMCLDFLLERVLFELHHAGDGVASVFAEARNRSDDAALQLEYQRLQLQGTLFQAPAWFRHQLASHITFLRKGDNEPGLQLVDVLLRAVMDKLSSPRAEPERWSVAAQKLYRNERGRVRSWGLKVFPESPDLMALLGLDQDTQTGDTP